DHIDMHRVAFSDTVLLHGRLTQTGSRGSSRCRTALDNERRHEAWRIAVTVVARPKLQRSLISDECTTLRRILIAQEPLEVDVTRAVVHVAIRHHQLQRLENGVRAQLS